MKDDYIVAIEVQPSPQEARKPKRVVLGILSIPDTLNNTPTSELEY